MSGSIKLMLGDDSIRFTPDGMVFIEDAIKVLISENDTGTIFVWKKMQKDHPGILDHCGSYVSNSGDLIQTIDIDGLDEIFRLLPEYM